MAAPVGRSSTNEPARPTALATMPVVQAMASTTGTAREKIEPMTAGTIRKLKTRSTPAVVTELVTTTPNDRKNRKSHTGSMIGRVPAAPVSAAAASSGRRATQWNSPIAA